MPEPLHHSTLAAIVRLAQARGLPIVRADIDRVVLGDTAAVRDINGLWRVVGWGSCRPSCGTALHALRAALRETPSA